MNYSKKKEKKMFDIKSLREEKKGDTEVFYSNQEMNNCKIMSNALLKNAGLRIINNPNIIKATKTNIDVNDLIIQLNQEKINISHINGMLYNQEITIDDYRKVTESI